MDLQQSINVLTQQGWSQRRIALELDINRETVARYRQLARMAAEPAISPAGVPVPGTLPTEASDPVAGAEPAILPPGSAPVPSAGDTAKPAISPAGRRSHCEAFQSVILSLLELGLSAQRIFQDLVAEHQFPGSYDSVKRFVARRRASTPLPFRRLQFAAGRYPISCTGNCSKS